MGIEKEVLLTAQRELRRNLRSTKGIAMFVLFVLGGTIPSLVQVLIERAAKTAGLGDLPEAAKTEARKKLLEAAYDGNTAIADYLSHCPAVLYGLFKGTLLFVPLLVLLVGFDHLSGELQHRTLRYFVGRAHRGSLVAGKAIGVWGVIAVMITVLHAVVWIIVLARSEVPFGDLASWGGRMLVFSICYAAAYVGLIDLVSSLFKTPIVGLFIGAGVMFAMAITNLVLGIFEKTEQLTWAFPSTYERLLVSPEPLRAFGGMALLIGWGSVCVAIASEIIRRRDV